MHKAFDSVKEWNSRQFISRFIMVNIPEVWTFDQYNPDKGSCYSWVRHHTEYCNEVMNGRLVKEACPVTCSFCQQTVPGYFISKIEHHVDSMNVYGDVQVDVYVDGNVVGEEN
jgi:hypothetical protein